MKYEGKDTQGRKCDFYVSIHEEEEDDEVTEAERDHEHGHHMLMKVDYTTLDGHKPHAGEAQFYLYDSNTGKYYDEDSNQPDTTLSLLSMSLKDPDATPDVNLINDYLANAELDQYLRVEFTTEADPEAFEEALEDVLENNTPISDNLDVFDNIQLISMATAHADHYHFPTCLNYKPVSVEETEFEMEDHDHDHDDHDHDDDDHDDDDHDHDHDDE
ncbi:MAG: hypothetical protein KDD33_12515 [Bdellovibrionales bacterium]|nr:hypothetical protein [Bdellovibrionales bacterium]